ncbi:MAG: bacillithiol biosynthesis cysteine-adding enzyme BshC [Calditrichaceae bacterium]
MHPLFYNTNTIHQDYIAESGKLNSFIRQPLNPDWKNICRDILKSDQHRIFIKELIRQNQMNADAKVLDNLNLLEEKNTVIIITGQQLGLFLSPLYTVYKTITTIMLADKLNAENHGFHFVPVFWLETEDHDFQEVNHFNFWTKDGTLANLNYEDVQGDKYVSIGNRGLDGKIVPILNQLRENLQETEFTNSLFEALDRIYKPGRPWHEAFSEQMMMLFKEYGLLLFNPSTESVKEKSIGFFEEIVKKNSELLNKIEDQSRHLEQSGYFQQVHVQGDKSYLFYKTKEGKREAIIRDGDFFRIFDHDEKLSGDQLIRMIHANPGLVSSTVLTRPLWQSWMLPVASYVAGPAEIAYWAQISAAFDSLGIVMPHLKSRISATLIEPKIQRLLNKYEIDPDRLQPDADEFIADFFRADQFRDLDEIFMNLKKAIDRYRQEITGKAIILDPTAAAPVEKTFDSIEANMDRLAGRLIKKAQEQNALMTGHFETIYKAVLPEKHMQERYIGSIYFLNKYGPGWIQHLFDNLKLDRRSHQIIQL